MASPTGKPSRTDVPSLALLPRDGSADSGLDGDYLVTGEVSRPAQAGDTSSASETSRASLTTPSFPADTSTSLPATSSRTTSSPSKGWIAGAVLGCVALLAGVGIIEWLFRARQRRKEVEDQQDTASQIDASIIDPEDRVLATYRSSLELVGAGPNIPWELETVTVLKLDNVGLKPRISNPIAGRAELGDASISIWEDKKEKF